MWIRSQNNDVLLDVKDVCFYEVESEDNSEIIYEFRCYGYGDDYYILGKYLSKENALKVLDDIQSKLNDELEMNLGVYQIPKDWSEEE